jgi:hypothetical protein
MEKTVPRTKEFYPRFGLLVKKGPGGTPIYWGTARREIPAVAGKIILWMI